MNTIFAISSGRPPAAIAIMRISGPEARQALVALAGDPLPEPRHAALRVLRDDRGEMLDRALVLWFPGPANATGEDLAELHLHGGRAIVAAVEEALAAQPGLRRADPGEYTRRALLNGVIDLSQAEGLADLLEAETEAERRAAISRAEGHLGQRIRDWLATLTDVSAQIEAMIDYSEDDVPDDLTAIEPLIATVATEMHALCSRPTMEELREGIRVVFAGPPNAGKSSLFNALIGRDAAIVTDIAGTTRDVLEASVQRDGRQYRLIDTAGLTQTNDVVERIGIARARNEIGAADVILWLGDDPPCGHHNVIAVHPRADEKGRPSAHGRVPVSIYQPDTLEALWTAIAVATTSQLEGTSLVLDRHQRDVVAEALDELSAGPDDIVLIAERLRRARAALARLLGFDVVESVLDTLFGRFCLGK